MLFVRGQSYFELYDSASDMENRRFCSAHFATSSELRKTLIVSNNQRLHRFFTIDKLQKRGYIPSRPAKTRFMRQFNPEIQDLTVYEFLWIVHFYADLEALDQGPGLSLVI